MARTLRILGALLLASCGGPGEPDAGPAPTDGGPEPADAASDVGAPAVCPLSAVEREALEAILFNVDTLTFGAEVALDDSDGERTPLASYLTLIDDSMSSFGGADGVACPTADAVGISQCSASRVTGLSRCYHARCPEPDLSRVTTASLPEGRDLTDLPDFLEVDAADAATGIRVTGVTGVRFEPTPVFDWTIDRRGPVTVDIDHTHAAAASTADGALDLTHRTVLHGERTADGWTQTLTVTIDGLAAAGAIRCELEIVSAGGPRVVTGALVAPGLEVVLGSLRGIAWPRECL